MFDHGIFVEFLDFVDEIETYEHNLDAGPVEFLAEEETECLHGVLDNGRGTLHGPDFCDFLFGDFEQLVLAVLDGRQTFFDFVLGFFENVLHFLHLTQIILIFIIVDSFLRITLSLGHLQLLNQRLEIRQFLLLLGLALQNLIS